MNYGHVMSPQLAEAYAGLLFGSAILEHAVKTGRIGSRDVRQGMSEEDEAWGEVSLLAGLVSALGELTDREALCRMAGANGLRGNVVRVAHALNELGQGYIVLERSGQMYLEGLGNLGANIFTKVASAAKSVAKSVGKTVAKTATKVASGVTTAAKAVGTAATKVAEKTATYVQDPMKIIDDLRAELRKIDPTTDEGRKFLLTKVKFFLPPFLADFIANFGEMLNCMAGKPHWNEEGNPKESNWTCFAKMVMNHLKAVITSGEFQVILGYFTQNWPLVIAGACKITGEAIAGLLGKDTKTGAYVMVAFKVFTEGMDIARMVYTQGASAMQNAALYVMIGEMFTLNAGAQTMAAQFGAFITKHAQIMAKAAKGDMDAVWSDIRAQYIDPLTNQMKNVDVATIASWAAIAAGLVAIADFFTRMSGANDKDPWLAKKLPQACKNAINNLGALFRKGSETLTMMVNTFNDSKKLLAIAGNPAAMQAKIADAYQKGLADAQKMADAAKAKGNVAVLQASVESRLTRAAEAQKDAAQITADSKKLFTTGYTQAQTAAVNTKGAQIAYQEATDPLAKQRAAMSVIANQQAADKAMQNVQEGVRRVEMAEGLAKLAKEEEAKALADKAKLQAAVAQGKVPAPPPVVKPTSGIAWAAALPLLLLL